MFAYLSKKLFLTKDVNIQSLAWNKYDDQLALGGTNGLIKMLVINDSHDPSKTEKEAAK